MNVSRTSRLDELDDISAWVTASLCALLPVIFVTPLVSEFYLPKMAVLVMAAAALGMIAAIRYVTAPGIRGYPPLDIPVAVFGLSVLFSFVFSVEPASSFIGRYNYPEGVLTITGYLLLYLSVSRVEWSARRLKILLWAIAAGAAAVCAYALVQIAGVDPIRWELTFNARRVASTLGNPTQLAAYLVAVAPLVALLAVRTGAAARAAALTLLMTMAFVLWRSEGRSGMVAAAAALAVALSVRYWAGRRPDSGPAKVPKNVSNKGLLIGVGVALFLIAATVAVSLAIPSPAEEAVPSAFESARTGPPPEDSLEDRRHIWLSSLAMIAERPFAGWGPDVFELKFPQFQSLASARLESADGQLGRRAEDAHDVFLEYAATLGLAGLTAFILLLVSVFGATLKSASGPSAPWGPWTAALAAAALTAFLIPALTTPLTMASATFFWLVLGLVSSRQGTAADRESAPSAAPTPVASPPKHTSPPGLASSKRLASFRLLDSPAKKALLLSLAAAASAGLFAIALIAVISDAVTSQGEEAWQARQPALALPAYAQAARINPWRDKYLGQYGLRLAAYGTQNEDRAGVEAGLGLLAEARRANPAEATYPLIMARYVLDNAASKADVDRARELLREALMLAPNDARVSLYSAESSAILQRAEASPALAEEEERALTRAIAIAPTLLPAWKSLGQLYLRSGRIGEAERAYVEAERISPRDPAVKEALDSIRRAPSRE